MIEKLKEYKTWCQYQQQGTNLPTFEEWIKR